MRLLIGAVLAASLLQAAEEVPDWVKQAAATPPATYPAKVAHLVLLSEEHVTVDGEGRHVMQERGAIRVLQKTASRLMAGRSYNSKSGRIASFQGWVLPPSGKPVFLGKSSVLDQAAEREYTYDESRYQSMNPGHLEPGSVFAWQIVEEEKSVFTFSHFSFQGSEPVMASRFVLTVPPGWEVRGVTFNRAPVEPQVAGGTYTWELRNLPWIEDEEASPEWSSIVPQLGVNYFPSSDSRPELRPLKDWAAVASWMAGFADPAAEVTPAIRAKAAELTAGATTELAKIRAIGKFVQKTNYVEVMINVTKGGGYTPRHADDVLSSNYGDCKDKATLMRALLKAAGIESYMISIFSGDRDYVRPEWPAPQFNHAIIAVRVSPDTKVPPVLEHPKLGRLLFFDPTSRTTGLGDLPVEEQGSRALVDAATGGELVTVPLFSSTTSRMESKVEATLERSGKLSVRVDRTYFGQASTSVRHLALYEKADELKRVFAESLSERIGGLTLDTIEPKDRFDENELDLSMKYTVVQFGRLLQDRMLLVSPGELATGAGFRLPAKERKLPVQLRSQVRKDVVTLAVPSGFKVDEIPDPMKIDGPYGLYTAQWKADGDKLLFERTLAMKDVEVPAADYAKVRKFLDDVVNSQGQAVVLVKP